MTRRPVVFALLLVAGCSAPERGMPLAAPGKTVRIGATQPRSRLVDWHLRDPDAVLSRVEDILGDLEGLVHRAGVAGCDVVVFPEDTLGLGGWEIAHPDAAGKVLPRAIDRMLARLGSAASSHRMYLVCSSDSFDGGAVRNSAFFLGRDGTVIGRYHKVDLPIHELDKKRGDGFPVFPTADLGTVGMLICYDMVFPEAPRCLALAGADVIFHPTLGGAAIGDGDISRAAFRTRAVENFVYLVVSERGSGTMIVSPQGKILAEGQGPDDLAIADIDPASGRSGGDSMNTQEDMRSRLFRERSPAAYGILTDPEPPVLRKVPETTTIEDAVRISRAARTEGERRFSEAAALERDGRREEAILAYEALVAEYPRTWIDTASRTRLARLRK